MEKNLSAAIGKLADSVDTRPLRRCEFCGEERKSRCDCIHNRESLEDSIRESTQNLHLLLPFEKREEVAVWFAGVLQGTTSDIMMTEFFRRLWGVYRQTYGRLLLEHGELLLKSRKMLRDLSFSERLLDILENFFGEEEEGKILEEQVHIKEFLGSLRKALAGVLSVE